MATRKVLNQTPVNQRSSVWETMWDIRVARYNGEYHQKYVAPWDFDHTDKVINAAHADEIEGNSALLLMEAFRTLQFIDGDDL